MPYILNRNGKVVQHVVFIGDYAKNNFREHKIIDLVFETKKGAEEVANVLNAEVEFFEELKAVA